MMSDGAGRPATGLAGAARTSPGHGVIVHRRPLTALATGPDDLAPLAAALTALVDELLRDPELGFGPVAAGLQQFVVDFQPSGVAAVLDLAPDPIVFLFDQATAIGDTATHRAAGRSGWTTVFVEGDQLNLTVGDGAEQPVIPWSMLIAGTIAGSTAQVGLSRPVSLPSETAEPAEPAELPPVITPAIHTAGLPADDHVEDHGDGLVDVGPAPSAFERVPSPFDRIPSAYDDATSTRGEGPSAPEPTEDPPTVVDSAWGGLPDWLPTGNGHAPTPGEHLPPMSVATDPEAGAEMEPEPSIESIDLVPEPAIDLTDLEPEPGIDLTEPTIDPIDEGESAPLWTWTPPEADLTDRPASPAPAPLGAASSDLAVLASALDEERVAMGTEPPTMVDPAPEELVSRPAGSGLADLADLADSQLTAELPAGGILPEANAAPIAGPPPLPPPPGGPANGPVTELDRLPAPGPGSQPISGPPPMPPPPLPPPPGGISPVSDLDRLPAPGPGSRPISGPPPMPPPPNGAGPASDLDRLPAPGPQAQPIAGQPPMPPPPMPPPPDGPPETARDRAQPPTWTEAT